MSRKERRKLAKMAAKGEAAGQSAVFPATATALERQFNDAMAHFQAGHLKEVGLMEFQRLQPDIPEVLHLMALIELPTGRPEAAAGHLEKAVARQPESADLHNLLGGALKRAGRTEVAVAAFDKAVSLDPDRTEAHYNLGNAGNSFGVPFFMSPVSVIHPK